jgi:NAD(P)-dependent dehydrogenase (short-subunit alcohol dehydrogenase family)
VSQVVLVVGGSRGIGRDVALAAGVKGARIVVVARGPDAAQKTALEVMRKGSFAVAVLADAEDLGDSAAADRVLSGTWQQLGSFPTGLVLATPAVRQGKLGRLAMLVRRAAQKELTRLVVLTDDGRILDQVGAALEGVPRAVEIAAIGPGETRVQSSVAALGL